MEVKTRIIERIRNEGYELIIKEATCEGLDLSILNFEVKNPKGHHSNFKINLVVCEEFDEEDSERSLLNRDVRLAISTAEYLTVREAQHFTEAQIKAVVTARLFLEEIKKRTQK